MRKFQSLALALVMGFGLLISPVQAVPGHGDTDESRAKLISFLLRQQLSTNHYANEQIDDAFSRKAYDLYLKRLDGQKRFLLKEDVEALRPYATRMDDELNAAEIKLPSITTPLLNQRVEQAREVVREILAQDFDFTKREEVETDPEKIEFSANQEELRERWRKILKLQVLSRYLDMQEDAEAQKDGKEAKTVTQADAREKILKSYETSFSRKLEESEQDHYDQFFEAVTHAFDPHTSYLPPAQKEDFDISMRGSLEGIGATLREEDGYIKVVSVVPGSAAWRQGQLEAEDIILKVAEKDGEPVDITDTSIRDAVSLIRGKKGTEVRLTIRKPDGRGLVVPIVRDVVQIEDTFVKSTVIPEEETGKLFGYVKIPSFYRDFNGGSGRNVTDDLAKEIASLKAQNVDGMVLDLRNNGGGALTDAVSAAGLFIEKGPIVQIRDADGKVHVLNDKDDQVAYGGPLVVLVNQFSASASEILAGALQDYGRAVVIGGEHTHGKGTVQAIVDLDRAVPFVGMKKYLPLGALKVTIQKFYRVSGESTQYRGIEPDIVLPDRLQHLETGEKYIDYSLPWDTIEPTEYSRWDNETPSLSLLREKSRERVDSHPKFSEIASKALLAKKRTEETRQSLYIEDVRREREEMFAFDEESPHGLAADSAEEPDRKLDKEGRRKLWEKNVREDPYAGEAVAVLDDWISLSASKNRGGSAETAATQ